MKLPKDKAKARKLIALDVITRLTENQFHASKGHIMGDDLGGALSQKSENKSAQLTIRGLLKRKEVRCEVCGKGAILASHVLLFNQMSVETFCRIADNTVHELPEFSYRLMAEIETLFEGHFFSWNAEYLNYTERQRLLTYCSKHLAHLGNDSRLIHIMNLLVQNDGRNILLPEVEAA